MKTSFKLSSLRFSGAGFSFLLLTISFLSPAQAQVVPLPNAHAHNDYMQPRPLLDALSHGFTSLEADVLLIDGELYVGHDMPEGEHNLPTLKKAYLDPLARVIDNNRGEVYPDFDGEFFLMIDLKTEAEASYAVLRKQLTDYAHILSQFKNGQYYPGALTIFLSGNRPIGTVSQEKTRYAGLDGRPEDLGKGHSADLMPVISENYFKVIRWNGEGEIPAADFLKLKQLAIRAHNEDKKVRLWAAPDQENVWAMLQRAGIDLINTDRLPELKEYLLKGHAEH
ncbi:MAG: phosphatidylinositol-specific phospholipase C/glycerophosphodiester phosphodiesterase family protein [Cyclobacteriaceae bacterium]